MTIAHVIVVRAATRGVSVREYLKRPDDRLDIGLDGRIDTDQIGVGVGEHAVASVEGA